MLPGLVIGFFAALLLAAPLAWFLAVRAARRARASENTAAHAQRLAELTTLTGGLAHEIRNPLATVRLSLQLLAEEWAKPSPDALDELSRRSLNRLATLQKEADRLDDILADFLRYAGHHEFRFEAVDLNRTVGELLDFFAPQAAAARVRMRPGLTDEPLAVRLDVDLFKQALLNLLINACQAMADTASPELIVRTRRAGGRATVEVADVGPGIAPDCLEKIFQAYYSTKRHGTGLGLAVTRRIVAEHGGAIEVHSEPGRGSSFVISLPLADRPAARR